MEPKLPPNDPDPESPGYPPVPMPDPDEPDPDVFPQTDPGPVFTERFLLSLVLMTALLSIGCGTQAERDADRRRAEQDAQSAAYKAGEAAHRIAREAEKEGAVAAREVKKEA